MLDHVNIVVSDIETSVRFYEQTLLLQRGFERVLEGEWIERVTGLKGVSARCVFLESADGGARLELLQYQSPISEKFELHRMPQTLGVRHVAWTIDDLDALLSRLRSLGIEPISAPIEVPFAVGALGRKRLCYFRDPDGVLLEAAAYEKA